MDGEKQGAGRAYRILTVLMALLILGSVPLLLSARKVRSETAEAATAAEAVRASLEEELSQVRFSIAETEERIDRLNSLPEEIEKARAGYFENASRLEEMVENGETELKIAYLTFDDGPYEITDRYLDVLEDYGILATFFERWRDWDYYESIFRRVAASGHTIGNHSYTHDIHGSLYQSVDSFMEDILRNREFIQEHLGITTHVLRFPGGSGASGSLKQGIIEELRKERYAYVNWNSATLDGMYELSAAEYRDNVLDKTGGRKFLVVLMHDYSKNTLTALPEIIEGLQDQGYVFLPLFYESLAVNR